MKKLGVSLLAVMITIQLFLPWQYSNKANAMEEADSFYYETITNNINMYGIYNKDNYDYGQTGIVFVKLFDVNKNGVDDMYLLTLDENNNYVEEIYIDGKLIDSVEYSGPGSGWTADNSIDVAISSNELLTRSRYSYSRADGGFGNDWKYMNGDSIISYKDSKSKTNFSFYNEEAGYNYELMREGYSEGYSYEQKELDLLLKGTPDEDGEVVLNENFINDTAVSEAEYKNQLAPFLNKEWIELVSGGLGSNEVIYKQSKQAVNEALAHIINKYKPNNLGEDIKGTLDEAYLESMMKWINETGNRLLGYNINHKLSIDELLSIIVYLTEYSSYIEYENKYDTSDDTRAEFPKNTESRIPVSELDEFLSIVIGQTFDNDFTESKSENYLNAIKKDGYYYFTEFPSRGGSFEFPYVNKIYRLAEHTYYVDYNYLWIEDGTDLPSFPNESYSNASFVELNKKLTERDLQLTAGGSESYAIMKSTVINGETRWSFLESDTIGRLFTEEQIKSFNQVEPITKQIQISRESSNSLNSFIASINQGIMNKQLNDLDFNYLISRLTAEYQKYANLNMKAKKNTVQATDEELQSIVDLVKQSLQQITDGVEVTFTRPVPQVFRLNITNLDVNKPIYVNFDQTWLKLLSQAEDSGWLSLLFDGASKGILIQVADLKALLEQYEQLKLELVYADSDSSVTIQMHNGNETLSQLPSSMQVLIPSASPDKIVSYNNYVWGGMYNSDTSSMMFVPKYSGTYTLAANNIDISSELQLTEEQHEKITYLMSRGLFSQEEQSFVPSQIVTRNGFVKDLVLLFFALDEKAEATFTDVTQESSYYMHIASGQQRNIIKGFTDGTFGGEQNVTIAQVLSFAGRTLANDKGFVYPENADQYLQFIDINLVDKGMQQEIALAVQHGLYSQGGLLEPNRPITNMEAVEILYKLANLLYDDALYIDVDYEHEQDSAGKTFINENIVVVIVGGGVIIVGAALGVLYLLRRRTTNKSEGSA